MQHTGRPHSHRFRVRVRVRARGDACVLMGVIEVRYSLILNFIILIWGGASPLPDPTPEKKYKNSNYSPL